MILYFTFIGRLTTYSQKDITYDQTQRVNVSLFVGIV